MLPAVVLAFTSCADDDIANFDFTTTGEDATVRVSVALPPMQPKSRAALSDRQINEVRSLWIRTYSASTGKATSKWLPVTAGTTTTEEDGLKKEFDISTKSGNSYIVGVANVENLGVTKDNPDVASARPLSELLTAADTWDDFLNIAVVMPSSGNDVNAAPLPLTMAGCLSNISPGDMTGHPEHNEWGAVNFEPVFIPATSGKTYALPGAIHLRRLVSHITFNITSGDAVTVTPTSYTVVNVPKASWLYERDGDMENFGDNAMKDNADDYFATTPMYTSQYFRIDNGTYTFDFWQGENKQEALPDADLRALGIEFRATDPRYNYDKRELEKKNADGTNSGLFLCLTGETWTPANMATYVIVRADIEYKEKVSVDIDGVMTDVDRIGNAEYVVHLGFLDSNARDFNCHRNVDYNYNMKINGLNDVYIEATGAEQYPGVEGLISDVENASIYVDCHYNAFNVQLTRDEITGKTSQTGRGMGYVITTWDNDREYRFTEDNPPTADQLKYINWVELRPTTGPDVLAKYYPQTHATEGSKTFNLQDASEASTWADDDPRFSDSDYYTVFVAEYSYEDGADETSDSGTPNWMRYVNQNPRQFYIRVTKSVSDDGQSIYTRSKYAITQSSIQTFYSRTHFTEAVQADGENLERGTALGVERTNEIEGMNLRVSFNPGTLSAANGRYNMWLWINNSDAQWSTFVNETTPQDVPAVAPDNLQGGPAIEGGIKYLPSLMPYGPGAPTSESTTGLSPYDPQPSSTNSAYYIEAVNACMNRNRDNNGNGQIDADELRWFVPSMNMYMQMILGSNSLPSPMMDFQRFGKLQLPSDDNGHNTRYLFLSSDAQILWAMEGMSTSSYGIYAYAPWQIRCVRNLGSDLSTVTSGLKVVPPFEHDATNRVVRMTYYDPMSVRTITYSGNGDGVNQMPVHMISEAYNMPYAAFQYAESNLSTTLASWGVANTGITEKVNADICSELNSEANGTGWRLPNQKELAIMYYVGLQPPSGDNFFTSCTVSYFNENGLGGDYTAGNNRFMGMRANGMAQLSNYGVKYFRCVRDYTE